jgi:hypothetical protein
MKKATALLAGGLLVALAATPAFAVETIDGVASPAYGPAIVTQTNGTGFGDSNLGVIDYANGSELDAAYGYIDGGVLYLVLAGNLESNFNKLEVFIDALPGAGQNRLRSDNVDVDFNGLNRMGGLTFDSGFDADFYFTCTGGGGPYTMYSNYAKLYTGGGGTYGTDGWYLGQTTAGGPGTISGGQNPDGIMLSIDNSNVAGVNGGGGSGGGVTTGVEWAIPLSAIGNPVCVRVCAFINGSGHDFLANQVLGPLAAGTPNLGEPSLVDFNQHAGSQYFTVCDQATPAQSTTWGKVKSLYR